MSRVLLLVLPALLLITGCENRQPTTLSERQQQTLDYLTTDPRVEITRILERDSALEVWTDQAGERVVYLLGPGVRPDGLHTLEVQAFGIPALPIDPDGATPTDRRH